MQAHSIRRRPSSSSLSAEPQGVAQTTLTLERVAARLGWEVVEAFVDEESREGRDGKEWPALQGLLNAVLREEVDAVAAWSAGLLGKSLRDLLALLETLKSRGADLYLYEQGLDTGGPSGKAIYRTLELFVEFERSVIAERVGIGLTRARAQGKRLGRPVISPSLIEDMRSLRAKGHSLRWIAQELGVGRGTVEKYVKGR